MQVSTGGPELETLFKFVGLVVMLLSGAYAVERRVRSWAELQFLAKETAVARHESLASDIKEVSVSVDKLERNCMENTIALGQMGVMAKELSSLKDLEREHHENNVKNAASTRSEILQAIESKFGSILEEIRRLRH